MSLKRKATSGSFWTSFTRVGINLVDFVVYAYLARMLTLEEFGLVGFCFLFIEFSNTLVDAGVNQNIVQRDRWEDRYAASTMTFVAGIGMVVMIGILGIGAPIAYYSYSALAALVVASLAPITLIASLQVVVSGKLLREFKNKQMGIAKFCSTLISAITIIIFAENGFGLWALIIGKIFNSIIQYILLLYVAKFKPYFQFNKNDNRELISFCLPLLGMAIMNFLHQKASNMFTGFVLGPASFALLAAAQKGSQVINQVTMSSINSMVVPSFSRVKNKDNLGDIYIKMVAITALLVLPIFMGLAAIADPFVVIAFGEKFAPSAVYMTITSFSMFPGVVAWFLPNLLIAKGKTRDAFNLTMLNLFSSFVVAGATIWFGIKIMLISIVIVGFALLPLRLFITSRHVPINYRRLAYSLAPPYVSSLGMYSLLVFLKPYFTTLIANDLMLVMALIAMGAVIYTSIFFVVFFEVAKRNAVELISIFLTNKKIG
jgi:O-antigen/teichoic acid export membrane protein